MRNDIVRRDFLGAVGAVLAAGAAADALAAQPADQPAQPRAVKIVGIACSPRKGKTTAAAVQLCLDAAKQVSPIVEVELIELAEMNINGSVAAGVALPAGQADDFQKLIPKLSDPKVAGVIVGSPVYFGGMSSLCKAFLDRCMAFRRNSFALSNKVAGAVAVGGARNGGQELTIQAIQAALLCQEMIVVGDGKPSGRIGATLLNGGNDDISGDEFGVSTARNLGRRVAEVALRLSGMPKQ
jgi:multimeric flavodoxin WrbA